MPTAGSMKDRIALRRYVEDAAVGTWVDFEGGSIPAAVEALGDDTYRVRIRYRRDLQTKADIEPAVRMLYRGEEHDVTDVVEVVRHQEIHLTASRRIIDDITHLASGTRRLKAWP
jgi:hypothetical protein